MKSPKPKVIAITQRDLHQALKEPWDTRSCLLAQCAKRYGIRDRADDLPDPYLLGRLSRRANKAMDLFDDYWNGERERDRDLKLLRRLKRMLPIKVTIPAHA